MLPKWNISGVIIEPGGFHTEWATGSMVRLPPHPKYDTPDSPMNVMKRARETSTSIGEPERAAKAITVIVGMEKPPVRVQLGTDALLLVRNKALRTVEDGTRLEELSVSTDADDADTESLVRMFAFANAAAGK